ncbi:uncharacterized protein PHACADRAFT_209924 [Phanerochaete carnosa HHB-10118-sp]|uniref:Uncharacterized protein n=1 Tax=Phanerochaete carnosa (strain HHB-10118-sp) TaxID=650164 RepID=K5VRH4_PHACS|nr:uncharacterized protein PHACADRAFT_209924 [Phanerochaete carnosa HHB-10118-sp]EKM54103.1 hypothetical protein PHACADRAFT_209924 [Phanerochaete carnosa HHB-10118-sp]
MEDEDDYDNYFPPIDLSAQVLAELDSVERKFAATRLAKEPEEPPKPPPRKKQKIQHSSQEDSQYDSVPIVLGFGGNYFTQGREETNQRRDPPIPQQTRQSTAIHTRPAPAKASPSYVSSPEAPLQPIQEAQAQQSRALQPVRQSSTPMLNGSPQVASRMQTPQVVAHSKQNTWNHRSPSNSAVAGPSRPSPEPLSAGQSYAQGQRPHAIQQLSRQSSVSVTVPARHTHMAPVNAQNQVEHQVQRNSNAPVMQARNKLPLEAQPLSPLDRQSSNNTHVPQQSARPVHGGKKPNHASNLELSILRAQVAELQSRVEVAEEARYLKEGEVSILRAGITKHTQDHMAEIARLQAAREAAEAAKLQLVKEQKEEVERLKTQYTFRQHELETSSRKPPWSAQAKKIQSRPIGSPIGTPLQMRAWNPPRIAQPSSQVAQTPRRPRFGEIIVSPKFAHPKMLLPPPGPVLPGWQNSFAPSAKPASQLAKDKGKGRLREPTVAEDDGQAFFAPASSPPSPSPFKEHRPLPDTTAVEYVAVSSKSPASAPEPSTQAPLPSEQEDEDIKIDVKMVDDEMEGFKTEDVTAGTQEEESHEIESPNWRDEFQRLLFAHRAPGSDMPTLHSLLNSSIPASAAADLQKKYTSICAKVMEHLGLSFRLGDWDAYIQIFSNIIAELACILATTAVLSRLSALFDLLRTLCYTIPSFTVALMTPPADNASPRILTAICDVIRTYGEYAKMAENADERNALVQLTFSLLEALAWNIPEDLVSHLSIVIRRHEFMSIFITRNQPVGIMTHSVKLLALLATHPTLFRHLLSPPEKGESEEAQSKDLGNRLFRIHSLCYCLIEPCRDGPEHNELKDAIMTFFTTLSLAHPDALTILLKSRALIPSVIIYLSNLATPIWEEDEELVSSPEEASRLARKILRAIALLYYLIFTPDPPFDLRHQLHRPPARHLMSIAHVFTVTMSRIGYTSLPSWLSEEQRSILSQAVGMSKLLLEQVVDGPELDAIWTAFHEDDPPAGGGDEDEENEARLLHPAEDTDQ